MQHGKFVISLDFELLWGVRDKKSIADYGENIRAVHEVVPRLLDTFDKYAVSATFSTVGFLFFESKEELLRSIPEKLPTYKHAELSPYNGHFRLLGTRYPEDPYHFASHLIEKIKSRPQHEIGTHTFSHYYCLEEGQTTEQFRADIEQAIKIAARKGVTITSLVFPRNQFNDEYLEVCRQLGIICYRGNEHSWLYEARNKDDEQLHRRALRLIDAYFNISGHHTYPDAYLRSKFPVDIPSSRFLRPYNAALSFLEPLKISRITRAMTHAAIHHHTFHLWWHPHNFGDHTDENFRCLEKILQHYRHLHDKYAFQSYTMSGLARKLMYDVK
ncbi:MAG: polysaccharide deacetylase family protein [Chitinophagales bacterium]|nr:polysaccharide deacetylase family protein [Chitinophagales bacterium]MDW8417953.1 polysaccharide deacetylase family protein [Chitinophagales bacterium]